jgi:flagellar hook-length control protein FliK
MMSSATTFFPGLLQGGAVPTAAGEGSAIDGLDFTTAMAALTSGAAAPAATVAAPVLKPLLKDDAPVLDGSALPDAEAAALMASMMPTLATPTESLPAAPLADNTSTHGDAEQDADAALAAAGTMAALVAVATPAGTTSTEAITEDAASSLTADAAAAGKAQSMPAQAGFRAQAQNQANDATEDSPVANAGTAAAAQAVAPTLVSAATTESVADTSAPATPVPAALQAAAAATKSEDSGAPRAADRKGGANPLRQLLQAMTLGGVAEDAAPSAPPADPQTTSFASLVTGGADVAPPAAATTPVPQAASALSGIGDSPSATPAPASVGAQAAAPAPASPAPATHDAQHAVHSQVGSPRWAQDVGNQLLLMSTRGQQEGSLVLNPEHLGPVEVRISVNQNTANVWFGAQHADTRAALTEAMPRLRELFSDAGLSLGQAGVSHEAPRQQPQGGQQAASGNRGTDAGASREPLPAAVHRLSRGLVDTYA